MPRDGVLAYRNTGQGHWSEWAIYTKENMRGTCHQAGEWLFVASDWNRDLEVIFFVIMIISRLYPVDAL